MRFLALGLTILALFPSFVHAQDEEKKKEKPYVRIDQIIVGFPAGPSSGQMPDPDGNGKQALFKPGNYVPIWVKIVSTLEMPALELSAETADGDDAIVSTKVAVPPLLAADPDDPRKPFSTWRVLYLKPGVIDCRFVINLRDPVKDRGVAGPVSRSLAGLGAAQLLDVTIGSSYPGIRVGSESGRRDPEESSGLYGSKVQLGQLVDLELLPDRWIGYDGVDLLILGTGGNIEFWTTLAQPAYKTRREAIRDWVRAGGRLLISVGANPDVLEALPEIKELLPVRIDPRSKRDAESLRLNSAVQVRLTVEQLRAGDRARIALVTPTPREDRVSMPLLVDEDRVGGSKPVAFQGAFGLGRVTVVGFDLDRPPVTDWPSRAAFWEWLLNQAGPQLGAQDFQTRSYQKDDSDGLMTNLQSHLETFEGVPVISFGWVALFILGYILLIGPVDYFVLKKVFGRLEWTWVTFPLIVLSVSLGAYYAAYALKGRDLKINKLDLVEVDVGGGRVFGRTYFTIFSPRTHSYTLGIEPVTAAEGNSFAWVGSTTAEPTPAVTLGWHGRAKQVRQGGLSRAYNVRTGTSADGHDLSDAGLERVPIAVWSTKSFSAEWSAPATEIPLIESTLAITLGRPNQLSGKITSHLPDDALADARLIWRDKVYDLTGLTTNVPKNVSFDWDDPKHKAAGDWARSDLSNTGPGNRPGTGPQTQSQFNLWQMGFADKRAAASSEFARHLDQSWRLAPTWGDQAILVARTYRTEQPAEAFSLNAASPTRLWVGEFPNSGKPRPNLPGSLRQEVFIRAYIPVKSPTPGANP